MTPIQCFQCKRFTGKDPVVVTHTYGGVAHRSPRRLCHSCNADYEGAMAGQGFPPHVVDDTSDEGALADGSNVYRKWTNGCPAERAAHAKWGR